MSWVQSKFTDYAVPPCKKRKFESSNTNGKTTVTTPVVDLSYVDEKPKWRPKVKSDLVVNSKKIGEVESWLLNCKTTKEPSILLMTGHPGCGKLTTLRVLCSGLKINLIEWLPQIAQRKYDPEGGEFCQSLSSIFEEFIVRATRYTNVLNAMSSRIVAVKDIPNCYLREPITFHTFLNKYARVHDVHLAFILTDVTVVRSLFPDHVKHSLNVTTVVFNPITQKGVKDVLKISFPLKCHGHVDAISASCNGDLRKAITSLEFASKTGNLPLKKSKSSTLKNDDKRDFLDIFHGLGRILYSKREKGKLVHDPITVGESFFTSPELFVGMLHENYLHTYSSIHDVAKAGEYLSSAEILLRDMMDISRCLSLTIASCGIMTNNSAPIKKFQQMNKPRKVMNVVSEFRSRFSDSNVFLDVATYGRAIPSYAQENNDWLSRINELK
uniref:Cell cycle checkpoint protein RAD17 n=1 Tax=Lygus hesperus TaxID=30085 RepID=A0A0K8S4M7_LYGHE